MAKKLKDTERLLKAAGEKYKLTTKQKQLLGKLAEQGKKKSQAGSQKTLRLLGFLAVAAVLLLVGFKFFFKPSPAPLPEDKLVVHFIDVGQGDCIFIAANGSTMLIDCGEASNAAQVTNYLQELGVDRLDHVIATHPHSDHMGGMYRIIDTFDVGEVIIPHIPDKQLPDTLFFEKFLDACEANDTPLSEAETGRIIDIGDAKAEIIAPDGDTYTDLNNYSVSLMLTHGKNSFLLTGDAEKKSEAAMLGGGRLGKVNVYKAGHHGSSSSSSAELLEVIRPEIAVISCGIDNSYGHPSDSTVKRLSKYTKFIYRTDLCGTIIIESDGTKLSLTAERNI